MINYEFLIMLLGIFMVGFSVGILTIGYVILKSDIASNLVIVALKKLEDTIEYKNVK